MHDRAEQFLPANALAAQDADDDVVAGGLEVADPAAAGDLQQVVNDVGERVLGRPLTST